MNNILAIDTSGHLLNIGIAFGGDRIVQVQKEVEQSHGQLILKTIEEMLQSAALKESELNTIVVNIGPGSFTGLRIGLATAKGMAVALGLDLVGVNIFELVAYKLQSVRDPVMVITPLKKDEFFACEVENGLYDKKSIQVISLKVLKELEHSHLAGVNLDLKSIIDLSFNDYSAQAQLTAADLIAVAQPKIEKGEFADLAALEPMYIQKSQAEINYDKRRQ